MLRQRLSERFSKTPYTSEQVNFTEDQPVWTEWKVAFYGLIFSIFIFAAKIFIGNKKKLISYQVLSEEGQQMIITSWKHVAKYSKIWLPILCGALSSYFTWIMVYLDSNVPGVQPPSPLSPKKFKDQSGHTFHLNYVFALIIGVLVTSYMYLRGISIMY